jgi:hypothetical protein
MTSAVLPSWPTTAKGSRSQPQMAARVRGGGGTE